jgi:hypothetical protein
VEAKLNGALQEPVHSPSEPLIHSEPVAFQGTGVGEGVKDLDKQMKPGVLTTNKLEASEQEDENKKAIVEHAHLITDNAEICLELFLHHKQTLQPVRTLCQYS